MNQDLQRLCEAAQRAKIDGQRFVFSDEYGCAIVIAVLTELRKVSEPMMDAAHPHVGGSLVTSGSYDDAFKATIDSILQGD